MAKSNRPRKSKRSRNSASRKRPIAVLSDVHANLAALEAVLYDIQSQGVERIFCLGDVVGYGPSPVECLDLVRASCEVVIRGNHDNAALELIYADDFNELARKAIVWTHFELGGMSSGEKSDPLKYLDSLPLTYQEGKFLFVHGSPRNPLSEYVFPDAVNSEPRMLSIFEMIRQYAFCGHTHVPGVFVEEDKKTGEYTFTPQSMLPVDYELPEKHRCLVNVGSVGQPRDGNKDACYLILRGRQITYRRVPYDINDTAKMILANKDLPDKLAERLQLGV